jgi:SAM-dependent methyltransferase
MSAVPVRQQPGTLGLSEELRRFVAEMPYERQPIVEFLAGKAGELPPESRVADVGAGDAPYRELFSHVDYVTIDWEHSPHEGASAVDLVASADAIPLPEGSFDAVLLNQVLEHVPNPAHVLAELLRILRPGGHLFVTVPLVWELHEMPFDYFRYTSPGLRTLLEQVGFEQIEVTARNDCFTTLAQMMRNIVGLMGSAPDGLDDRRRQVAEVLPGLAEQIAALAPLDARMIFPLGYAASAVRPESSRESESSAAAGHESA